MTQHGYLRSGSRCLGRLQRCWQLCLLKGGARVQRTITVVPTEQSRQATDHPQEDVPFRGVATEGRRSHACWKLPATVRSPGIAKLARGSRYADDLPARYSSGPTSSMRSLSRRFNSRMFHVKQIVALFHVKHFVATSYRHSYISGPYRKSSPQLPSSG